MTRWMRLKSWKGFGIFALIYIGLWFYFLFAVYLPWSAGVNEGSQGWYPFSLSMSVAMFLFLVPGLFGLPGAFYLVWIGLLRRMVNH